jgi:hypothetical protein
MRCVTRRTIWRVRSRIQVTKNGVRFTYPVAFFGLAGRCAGRTLAKRCEERGGRTGSGSLTRWRSLVWPADAPAARWRSAGSWLRPSLQERGPRTGSGSLTPSRSLVWPADAPAARWRSAGSWLRPSLESRRGRRRVVAAEERGQVHFPRRVLWFGRPMGPIRRTGSVKNGVRFTYPVARTGSGSLTPSRSLVWPADAPAARWRSAGSWLRPSLESRRGRRRVVAAGRAGSRPGLHR